jgi:YD repeat-containing protein
LSHNDVYGNGSYDYSDLLSGFGDISSDPVFAGAEKGNYHLTIGSRCIDAGDDSVVDPAWTDIDGEPRSQYACVDIGADEFAGDLPFCVQWVSPTKAANMRVLTLTIAGARFQDGAMVRLSRAGVPDIEPLDKPTFINVWRLRARFDLRAAEAGLYDVVVTNPDQQCAVLAQGFEVQSSGEPHLRVQANGPSQARSMRDYVLWVEYGNDGTMEMPVPVFVVSSPQPILMRLGTHEPFAPGSAQALGIGLDDDAGVLYPGAYYRIPIHFMCPYDLPGHSMVQFDVEQMVEDSSAIDWATIEQEVRPDDIDPDAWQVIWSNVTSQVGSMWAQYAQRLREDATYLSLYGNRTYDIRKLLAFEIAKASAALCPKRVLAAAVDAYRPGSVLPLALVRVAPESIDQRYRMGPFGRGWSHNFEYTLRRPEAERIVVKGPGGSGRTFLNYEGRGWQPQPGDYGQLTEDGQGGYILREKDGLVWRFCGSGELDYIEEPNGNRLTLYYDAGRLVQVMHTDGASLTIEYTGDRITRVVDDVGRETLYDYDSNHLWHVVAPGGPTTTYAYDANHGLREIAFPDGTHRYYTYDGLGRLAGQCRDQGAEAVQFTYDSLGTVQVTDALGATATLRLGAYGEPLMAIDPLGHSVSLQGDDAFNLTKVIGPDGGTWNTAYDAFGNPRAMTDAAGNAITMGHTGDFSRLDWLKDARTNLTDFDSDPGTGNLTKITYPDTRYEEFEYDEAGNAVAWTNRRGDEVGFTYDAQGRIAEKLYPGGRVVTYEYDERGNLISASDPETGAITMQYDARDFLRRIEYPGGHWFEFDYSDSGRRTQRRSDDGYTLNYHYDPAGRLEALTDGLDQLICPAGQVLGRLTKQDETARHYKARGSVCRRCEHFGVCTKNKNGRVVTVSVHEERVRANRERVHSREARPWMQIRRQRGEAPFGHWKRFGGLRRMAGRGLGYAVRKVLVAAVGWNVLLLMKHLMREGAPLPSIIGWMRACTARIGRARMPRSLTATARPHLRRWTARLRLNTALSGVC